MKNKTITLTEYFKDVETTQEHDGYFISVAQALTVVILGSLCGLKNMSQIHQWASNPQVQHFLKEHFHIKRIPSYYWLTQLIGMIKPDSLNDCFINWVQSMVAKTGDELTVSFDGKTIRSTHKLEKTKPIHIVSAHIGNLQLTLGQTSVTDKSNEIPAVRDLIGLLDLTRCLVVADALHCQKETAKTIIEAGADYLLNAKGNQKELKEELETYILDPVLQKGMNRAQTLEKNKGRIEERIAYTLNDISWLHGKENWKNLTSFGAIYRRTTYKENVSEEWHFYISSRALTAQELLTHARLEWSIESMHWLLDVHYHEDQCRIQDEDTQKILNMVRKIALNTIRCYKEKTKSKSAMSHLMLNCLIDSQNILDVLAVLD